MTLKAGDPKLTLIRAAKTGANYKYGMGGLPKTHKAPKPITLPKAKCLEPEPDDLADT